MKKKLIIFKFIIYYIKLGIGDWGFGPIPNPQSPIPNPHPHLFLFNKENIKKFL